MIQAFSSRATLGVVALAVLSACSGSPSATPLANSGSLAQASRVQSVGNRYSGVLAWYRFNSGPNNAPVKSAIDSGPYGLTGTVTGGLTYSNNRTPRDGGPFSLNATGDYDYVTVPDNSALDPTGDFSLSAWAYPTGGQSSNGVGDSIADKHESPSTGNCIVAYGIYYSAWTNQFSAAICNSSDPSSPEIIVSSKDTYPLNQWHFVELRYSLRPAGKQATLELLVDGTVEGSQKFKDFAGINYTSGPFQIGAENSGGDHGIYRRNFYGYIDEVKLLTQ